MTGEQDDPDPSQSAERRHGDRRAGADRRKQNWGPPSGVDRRKGERRRGERRTSTAVPEAYARDITNDDYGSWADFRDPVEFDPRAPEWPQRVIHLPSGLGPRE